MADKKIGEVYHTTDTSKFKYLEHNRDVDGRVPRVKKSIEENGWISQPITVNKKMQVIDGQARLQACKELGIGITYAVIPGLGINECRVLNSISSNWTFVDHIKSHADEGDVNYQYLFQLYKRIKDKIGPSSLSALRMVTRDANIEKKIPKGTVTLDEHLYNTASNEIDYVARFIPVLLTADLRTSAMIEGLLFAAKKLDKTKKEQLVKSFQMRCSKELYPVRPTSFEHALLIIDEIYNFKKTASNKISLTHTYKMGGKYADTNETDHAQNTY